MCECKDECCACEYKEEELITKDDLVEMAIDEIEEGGCIGCTLSQMFEIGYAQGKADLARESRDFYQDVLEEEE